MALVPRPTKYLEGHQAIASTEPIQERESFFFALGPAREVFAEDLSLHPNSSGQGLLVHLAFRVMDHSGQSELQSRTVLTLRTQVDPRELPLLSGFIGRRFWVQSLEPLRAKSLELLEKENQQLKDRLEFLAESLQDLTRTLMES